MPAPLSTDADAARERRIAEQLAVMGELYGRGKTAEARSAFARLRQEISRRSPAQVEALERARGLR